MHQQERFVCVNCFTDSGMVNFIQSEATANECFFCISTGSWPIAAPIDSVSKHFISCLFQEYDLANNQLGWAKSEGGWLGVWWDSQDLAFEVLELEFPNNNEKVLLPLLFGEYWDQDWCEANAYGLNDQELARYSWEHFSNVVKHERRFFFLADEGNSGEPDVYRPSVVLDTIFEYAERMDLLKEMPEGSHLFRTRWEGLKPRWSSPGELGPPPREKAHQSNRLSPAGVSMFYSCDDQETALKEIWDGPAYFAIGCFETLRSAVLLDLTSIPPIPGLFDPMQDSAAISPRRILKFLHHVATEMSRPIQRDDQVHVEYVPTQIVTEFIRDQLTWNKSRCDGIKYFSSVHPGHVSYVLFANQSNIVGTAEARYSEDKWLKLTKAVHRWRGSRSS